MHPRIVLAVLLNFVLMLCGLWDIIITACGYPEETVSRILLEWSQNYPILPVCVGVFVGHLFWPQSVPVPRVP